MSADFQVTGRNSKAPFTLKLHRGDGMALVAMNWKSAKPPKDFVGFAIEYKEPGGDRFFVLNNRLSFPEADGGVKKNATPTTLAPIQKFRWVHFPRNAELPGDFVYRVTPVFMNSADELSYGEAQEAPIELRRETYPRQLNVAFTRGFVSSQAFVDRFESAGPISTLLPAKADDGLTFRPTHPNATDALAWMGFEARHAILELLDQAIADKKAQVRVVAYDLSEPDVVSRLERLGPRLKTIIDDDGPHGTAHSGETQAETRLRASAGDANVKRQHMGKLQHNKTIVVDGPKVRAAVCGSTNFSWRGFFVQANNAVVLRGKPAVKHFLAAFDAYWDNDDVAGFSQTDSAGLTDLGLTGIDARVGFSPHGKQTALLAKIADDIGEKTKSSVLYSLAFLYQTEGPVREAIKKVTEDDEIFVYGISDRKVGGIDVQKPDGNVVPVKPAALGKDAPEPFKSEPTGGSGNRMHHKFVVIDFDKPTARVYLGSYNFSSAADVKNGENLLVIRDRRIAVAYAVEALRIFDHYHFRVAQQEAKTAKKQLALAKPPKGPGQKPWWDEHYTNRQKVRDRELFA
jgi:phosphatidylserine/phosphatidylglycerophosphate/cardiolipin synthase-like enzyme